MTLTDGANTETLDPTLASATTSYTASVANTVEQITVAPTKTDTTGTYEFLDDSDAALTDAHTDTGFQVDPSVARSAPVFSWLFLLTDHSEESSPRRYWANFTSLEKMGETA